MLGMCWTAGSGGQLFDYKNPFDDCFSDHVESAGEAHISTELQTERQADQLEPEVTPADFVHGLVPVEGHMINPITGEQNEILTSVILPSICSTLHAVRVKCTSDSYHVCFS